MPVPPHPARRSRLRRCTVLGAPLLGAPMLLAALALPAAAAPAAPAGDAGVPHSVAVRQATGPAVTGSYVVTLRNGSDAQWVARSLGVRARHVYSRSVDGFAAALSGRQLAAVRVHPDVVAVEQDQVVRVGALQAVRPGAGTYGLDRIDQRALPLSGGYTYATTASTVSAYVIDTGIATAHPDFGGRASNVYDALGGNGQDCNGHGTHVAGTIGGRTYGVAKGVRLRGVRVLGCDGSGTTAGILSAVEWVRVNARKPAVANLSLGGGRSAALDRAVTALSASGVLVAVAAGNEGQDACLTSPAAAPAVVTVAATDRADTRAPWSNAGSCVDTYAPGVAVTSAWPGGGTRTISGTSMASPHVAGVAALYKARYGDAPSTTVSGWITSNATRGVVRANRTGTPNRLLFKAGL